MAEVIKASFDTESKEGKFKVYNAQNSTSESLKNISEDHVINVTDILIYSDVIDSYGQNQEGAVTVLFSDEGEEVRLYGSVSKTVSESADKLIDLINDLELDSVSVKVLVQQSNNGRDFISLQARL